MNEELIEALRKGERHAVEALYEQCYSYCASIVLNNNGSKDDARDLFQESIIVLYNNIRKEGFVLNCQIKTYLYSVMRNLWLKQLKRKSRNMHLSIDDSNKEIVDLGAADLESKMDLEIKHDVVSKAIGQIKEDCRTLLMKFYYQRLALKEIAKLMGYTDQFVKVKKNRCMEGLKKKVRAIQNQ